MKRRYRKWHAPIICIIIVLARRCVAGYGCSYFFHRQCAQLSEGAYEVRSYSIIHDAANKSHISCAARVRRAVRRVDLRQLLWRWQGVVESNERLICLILARFYNLDEYYIFSLCIRTLHVQPILLPKSEQCNETRFCIEIEQFPLQSRTLCVCSNTKVS